MLGANRPIFALDPKLDMDAETQVFHPGPKFLCFTLYFYWYFWFWYQTEIVPEKVYAVIWPVLEITSLNICQNFLKSANLMGLDDSQLPLYLCLFLKTGGKKQYQPRWYTNPLEISSFGWLVTGYTL